MLKVIFSALVVLFSLNSFSEDGHKNHDEHIDHDDHKVSSKHDDHDGHDDHKKKDDHNDHKDHSEKQDGFKLSPSGFKTFDLKLVDFSAQKTVIPKSAIYKGLNEVNIYRLRAGLYKRVDFKILSQIKSDYLITSSDLSVGDQIVINGVGFLRMAEIAATGGLSETHSH